MNVGDDWPSTSGGYLDDRRHHAQRVSWEEYLRPGFGEQCRVGSAPLDQVAMLPAEAKQQCSLGSASLDLDFLTRLGDDADDALSLICQDVSGSGDNPSTSTWN